MLAVALHLPCICLAVASQLPLVRLTVLRRCGLCKGCVLGAGTFFHLIPIINEVTDSAPKPVSAANRIMISKHVLGPAGRMANPAAAAVPHGSVCA